MRVVLVVGAGADWEPAAVGLLHRTSGVVVLRRCVDVDDLMAVASSGQAHVAVVALDAPGLDLAAVEHLGRHRVRVVAVAPGATCTDQDRERAGRLGVTHLLAAADMATLGEVVLAEPRADQPPLEADPGSPDPETPEGRGRVVAVWGPAGAPGRTTVAVGIAAALAARGRGTLLVDADPYAGAVAQQLGILDDVSGLLSASRLAAAGRLADQLSAVVTSVAPAFGVVTGLPRPDRWIEVRPGLVEQLAEAGSATGHVVLDTGFSLEQDDELGGRPGRNALTLGSLLAADEIVVVGAADPVGLSRLARGLVELRELVGGAPVRVVVNRNRPTLGWSERDIAGMVEGFTRLRGLHFLPEDRVAVDRALVVGRAVAEVGESALGTALAEVAEALVPDSEAAPVRRRRAGRAHRR